MVQKIKPISIMVQAMNIQNLFPESKVSTLHDQQLTWTHNITPSPLGEWYTIKLVYKLNETPKIYVVEPKPLALADGKTKLEHCYDQKKQRLCLYYPDGTEWNKTMLLASTIIPLTFDWLYHYEIWLITGEWTGGGVHPNKNSNKISDR